MTTLLGWPGRSVILETLERLLSDAGSDNCRILQANIWLAGMADFFEMNESCDASVYPANPPARACGQSKLATPDFAVEIIVVAATDPDQIRDVLVRASA